MGLQILCLSGSEALRCMESMIHMRVPHTQERKAVEQWLEAASKCMPAAREPLNAFHWDPRRLVTSDDLVIQLRNAAISPDILMASKPHLDQVALLPLALRGV